MYYGGRPERPNPAVTLLSALVGTAAGLVSGFVAFLLGTFFAHLLHTALPAMSAPWFVAVWIGALVIPTSYFGSMLRAGRGIGTKLYAGCGTAVIVVLFVIDVSGLVRVFPWDTPMYIVPAVIERSPAPVRR